MAQSTACSSSFAAAGLVLIEGSTLPLLKAPLFAVGLKLCGGGGIKRKPSPLGEGAPVRTLGRMRSVHQNRLCLPPIIETGRPSVPPLRFYTGTFETLGGRVRAPAPTANNGVDAFFS